MGAHVNLPFMFHAIALQVCAGCSAMAKQLRADMSTGLSCWYIDCRFALIRNFAGWEGFDGWARNAMFKILGEDKVMVEKLTPERLQAEFSLGPDAPQVGVEC
jgi:hypothetical protein